MRRKLLCFLVAVLGGAAALPAQDNPYYINLGDFAKGDGSDETEAIQRAIDSLPPAPIPGQQNTVMPGAVLFIPRPPRFYGISKTISVKEKWSLTIECETSYGGTRGMPDESESYYFHWLGPDGGTMFEFDSMIQLTVNNLSLYGGDADLAESYNQKQPDWIRPTRGVTGIQLGPVEQNAGICKFVDFNVLTVHNVAEGIRIGEIAGNGPDTAFLYFRKVSLYVSRTGILGASGNMANVEFSNVDIYGSNQCENGVRLRAGEILFTNLSGYKPPGADTDLTHSFIYIETGGVQVNKAWSEWSGPFLATGAQAPEGGRDSHSVNVYPNLLIGVRHYNGPWQGLARDPQRGDPVPYSIRFDRPSQLVLLDCSLWGSVWLGETGQNALIACGVTFVDQSLHGFTGPGIDTWHNLIEIGTTDPAERRVLKPYITDRRHIPGSGAPRTGNWIQGDRVVNVTPDLRDPSRAYAGWICIESGSPGKWAAYGKLEEIRESYEARER